MAVMLLPDLPNLPDLARSLWAQKGRSLSTLLGMVWGTMAVVLLLAFGFGLERELIIRGEGMGKGIVVAFPMRTTRPFAGLAEGRPILVTAKEILDLKRHIPEIDMVCPELSRLTILRLGARVLEVQLSGVYPSYGELRRMYPASGGRFLNDQDIEERRRVIFLGDGVRHDLFGSQEAVGKMVVIQGAPFRVIGVLEPKEQDSNYGHKTDDQRVCVPYAAYAQIFGDRYVDNFVYNSHDPRNQATTTRRVYEVLGRRKQFDPDDRQALALWDISEQQTMVSYLFLGFNTMFGAAGVLTLIVGGIGIGNLMFILVRQRTREIGIQMALGARPSQVLLNIVGEALVLVAAGGAVGFLCAWGICKAVIGTRVAELLGDPVLSPSVTVFTVTLLAIVGLLAGYFPARRAARLDPVLALAD